MSAGGGPSFGQGPEQQLSEALAQHRREAEEFATRLHLPEYELTTATDGTSVDRAHKKIGDLMTDLHATVKAACAAFGDTPKSNDGEPATAYAAYAAALAAGPTTPAPNVAPRHPLRKPNTLLMTTDHTERWFEECTSADRRGRTYLLDTSQYKLIPSSGLRDGWPTEDCAQAIWRSVKPVRHGFRDAKEYADVYTCVPAADAPPMLKRNGDDFGKWVGAYSSTMIGQADDKRQWFAGCTARASLLEIDAKFPFMEVGGGRRARCCAICKRRQRSEYLPEVFVSVRNSEEQAKLCESLLSGPSPQPCDDYPRLRSEADELEAQRHNRRCDVLAKLAGGSMPAPTAAPSALPHVLSMSIIEMHNELRKRGVATPPWPKSKINDNPVSGSMAEGAFRQALTQARREHKFASVDTIEIDRIVASKAVCPASISSTPLVSGQTVADLVACAPHWYEHVGSVAPEASADASGLAMLGTGEPLTASKVLCAPTASDRTPPVPPKLQRAPARKHVAWLMHPTEVVRGTLDSLLKPRCKNYKVVVVDGTHWAVGCCNDDAARFSRDAACTSFAVAAEPGREGTCAAEAAEYSQFVAPKSYCDVCGAENDGIGEASVAATGDPEHRLALTSDASIDPLKVLGIDVFKLREFEPLERGACRWARGTFGKMIGWWHWYVGEHDGQNGLSRLDPGKSAEFLAWCTRFFGGGDGNPAKVLAAYRIVHARDPPPALCKKYLDDEAEASEEASAAGSDGHGGARGNACLWALLIIQTIRVLETAAAHTAVERDYYSFAKLHALMGRASGLEVAQSHKAAQRAKAPESQRRESTKTDAEVEADADARKEKQAKADEAAEGARRAASAQQLTQQARHLCFPNMRAGVPGEWNVKKGARWCGKAECAEGFPANCVECGAARRHVAMGVASFALCVDHGSYPWATPVPPAVVHQIYPNSVGETTLRVAQSAADAQPALRWADVLQPTPLEGARSHNQHCRDALMHWLSSECEKSGSYLLKQIPKEQIAWSHVLGPPSQSVAAVAAAAVEDAAPFLQPRPTDSSHFVSDAALERNPELKRKRCDTQEEKKPVVLVAHAASDARRHGVKFEAMAAGKGALPPGEERKARHREEAYATAKAQRGARAGASLADDDAAASPWTVAQCEEEDDVPASIAAQVRGRERAEERFAALCHKRDKLRAEGGGLTKAQRAHQAAEMAAEEAACNAAPLRPGDTKNVLSEADAEAEAEAEAVADEAVAAAAAVLAMGAGGAAQGQGQGTARRVRRKRSQP